MPDLHVPALFVLVFAPMLFEAWLSGRNARALIARGAIEPPDDVYALMQVAYPLSFLAMLAEGWMRGPSSRWLWIGLGVFAVAKALKYWAIATLGDRWTFRVLVPPNSTLITHGPYRILRHPNYVGVAGELAGLAIAANAPVAGTIGFVCFVALLASRIAVEERALGGK